MPKPNKKKKSKQNKPGSQKSPHVEDLLESQLRDAGLRVIPIEADGNCLFRAFSFEINGDERML